MGWWTRSHLVGCMQQDRTVNELKTANKLAVCSCADERPMKC